MVPIYDHGEVSDRLAIYDLYARYVHFADAFQHDELDSVFEPDAVIDWSEAGYKTMTWSEAKADPLMGGRLFSHAFHINANILIRFAVGRLAAEVVSKTVNPVGVTRSGGVVDSYQVHGGYLDRLVRRTDGWRIAHRVWL